jgi:hypothetical protein
VDSIMRSSPRLLQRLHQLHLHRAARVQRL